MTQLIKINRDGDNLLVTCPRNQGVIDRIKSLRGKWTGKAWTVSAMYEDVVREALKEWFGTDGDDDTKNIVVDITLKDYADKQLDVAGLIIGERWYRDSRVKLYGDAVVIRGTLGSWGGSRKNPVVGDLDGVVVRLTVPETMLDDISADPIVDAVKVHKAN